MTNADSPHRMFFAVHALLQRAMGSRYLLFALAVHLAVLAFFGSRVVLRAIMPAIPPNPVDPRLIIPQTPSQPMPPPRRSVTTEPEAKRDDQALEDMTRVEARLPSRQVIGLPKPTAGPQLDRFHPASPLMPERLVSDGGLRGGMRGWDEKRLQTVWNFHEGLIDRKNWTGHGLPPSIFTCYLGKYADGDWNCNPTALENMLTQVGRWSKGRMQASVQPQALDLASDEIYKIKPPFIFLTGHRDFHFTPQEVENLREYLLRGGAIWADNSLPGRRSRFDESFRREMKRVFPDRDFEPVPNDHDVFNVFFHLKDVPKGMNDYKESLEQVRIGDELAVIYTQNAYSDLWETALTEENKIDVDLYLDEDTGKCYYKWGPHWGNSLTGFLYRNVNEESIVEANRLALNVIVHLLTRYDEKFRMLGKL